MTEQKSKLSKVEPDVPQLHLDNQICFQLYTLSRLVTQSYQPLLKPLGLTYPQYLVMLVLWQKDEGRQKGEESQAVNILPCPIKDITASLQLDTGTVTPLLKRMAANGLILRSKAVDDERKVLVDLTERGRALKLQAASVPNELLCSLQVPAEKLVNLHKELAEVMGLLQ